MNSRFILSFRLQKNGLPSNKVATECKKVAVVGSQRSAVRSQWSEVRREVSDSAEKLLPVENNSGKDHQKCLAIKTRCVPEGHDENSPAFERYRRRPGSARSAGGQETSCAGEAARRGQGGPRLTRDLCLIRLRALTTAVMSHKPTCRVSPR